MTNVRLIDGVGSELLETVIRLVREGEMSAALGAKIRQDGGDRRAVRAMLNEFFPPAPDAPLPEGSIVLQRPVRVDRAKSLPEMISEAGLSNTDSAIAALPEDRFPVDRSEAIRGRLVTNEDLILLAPYKEGIMIPEWWDWMDEHGLERRGTPELMGVARDYPELPGELALWGFGSSHLDSDGDLSFPALWSDYGSRKADAYWFFADDQVVRHNRAVVSRKRR